MAKTIAKIVHDIKPSIDELNEIMNILNRMASHFQLNQEFKNGLSLSNEIAETLKKYMLELSVEAKKENIKK